jgi:hypothetical protein
MGLEFLFTGLQAEKQISPDIKKGGGNHGSFWSENPALPPLQIRSGLSFLQQAGGFPAAADSKKAGAVPIVLHPFRDLAHP